MAYSKRSLVIEEVPVGPANPDVTYKVSAGTVKHETGKLTQTQEDKTFSKLGDLALFIQEFMK